MSVKSILDARRPRGELRQWLVTVLAFAGAALVATVVYLFGVLLLDRGPDYLYELFQRNERAIWVGLLLVLAWPTIATVAAAPVHFYLPDETVDRYHKLGKVFALLIPINVALTVGFLGYQHFYGETAPLTGIGDVIYTAAFASVALPPAYVGALVASRWLNNRDQEVQE